MYFLSVTISYNIIIYCFTTLCVEILPFTIYVMIIHTSLSVYFETD